MDHQHVEANGLIDLYRRGALPPDEEARFEEHFFGCPECTAQLEAARGLQLGLKAMAAEDVARTAVQAGLLAWLARSGRLARIGAGLALLLAAALPVLWLLGENRELRQARAGEERRLASERQAAEARLAESERLRERERRELEDRLAAAQKPDLSPPATPRPVVPAVFLLTAVRGEPDAPEATIDPGTVGETFSLAVDPGAAASYEAYRVTITDARGRRTFRQEGLRPNALEVLMITFPASSFSPGSYRLALEGLRPDGTAADLGGYPFRIAGP
jgi:hypothetical protein